MTDPETDLGAVLDEPAGRFERARRVTGLVLAPLVFLAVLLWPFPGLTSQAHSLAAIILAVIVLWVTEAIPMPVTALIGASACVLLGVASAKEVLAPFADPIMFLFIGSFMIAQAIFVHGLDRRLAFTVLSMRWVGARPGRILFAFGAVTAFISAWISNTATTAMMYAIGMSILGFLFKPGSTGTAIHRRYATGLMLMTSFSASIGGLATPIGTPPNLIGLHFLEEGGYAQITFFHWVILGVPVVVVLYLFLFGYLSFFCRAGVREIEGGSEMLRREREALGPLTAGQTSALIAFLVTADLWILPGVVAMTMGETSEAFKLVQTRIPESVAALVGAGLLFLLPGKKGERALTWKEAAKIDWGIVLLYGGGFALGDLAGKTKLAEAVGRAMTDLIPSGGGIGLLAASTLVAALVSEATSNTASAQIVVPVVISIAKAMGVDPVEPALGATFGSSLGFMLPVSTPCNAIVYGSGYIPLGRMIRYGFLLDVVGVAVVIALVKLLSPWVSS